MKTPRAECYIEVYWRPDERVRQPPIEPMKRLGDIDLADCSRRFQGAPDKD